MDRHFLILMMLALPVAATAQYFEKDGDSALRASVFSSRAAQASSSAFIKASAPSEE